MCSQDNLDVVYICSSYIYIYMCNTFIHIFFVHPIIFRKTEAKGALLSEAPHASPISTVASSDDLDVTSMESLVKPPLILPMLLASSMAVNVMLFLVILRSCKKRDDAGANGNFWNWIGRFFREIFSLEKKRCFAESAVGLSWLRLYM